MSRHRKEPKPGQYLGFLHKHRIRGVGTIKHFHGGGQNHDHAHPMRTGSNVRFVYVEDRYREYLLSLEETA